MKNGEWQVLIIGDIPEASDLFEHPRFQEEFPSAGTFVESMEAFDESMPVAQYDLVVLRGNGEGVSPLRQLRRVMPVHPLLLVCPPDRAECLLDARSHGIDDYLIQLPDGELFAEVLAEQIEAMLRQYAEPPTGAAPSARELQRYAQYYNVLHPFLVIDRDRIVRYYNDAARRFLRRHGDQAARVGVELSAWQLEDSDQEVDEHIEKALSGEELIIQRAYENGIDRRDLREIYYRPLRNPSDQVIALTVAIYTAQHPELHEARRMQAVGRLAAGIAHDFNNLLGIIATDNELMRQEARAGCDQPSLNRLLDSYEKIQTAVERGAILTDQLLTYTRREPAAVERIELNEVIDEIEPLIDSLTGEDIELEFRLDRQVPSIEADAARIEQVIMNLVANARDAMPRGGRLTVRTRGLEVDEEGRSGFAQLTPGPYAELSVEDTGGGMTDKTFDRMFDAFYSTKEEGAGGLGLATVERIVEQFGGSIRVDSTRGEGTRFELLFPASARAVDRHTERARASQDAGRGDDEAVSILLVEDEQSLRESLVYMLEREGYRVDSAESAEEARARVADAPEIPYQILLTDIVLSGTNGIDLSDELREHYPLLKTVLTSGYSPDVVRRYGEIDREQVRFLSKPVPPAKLIETLRELADEEIEPDQ